MHKLPLRARVFVVAVWSLGSVAATATGLAPVPRPGAERWEVALFVLLGVWAGRTKVRLMPHRGTEDVCSMSLGFALIYAALLRFGPQAALLVGAATTLSSCLLPKRQPLHQLAFNLSLNAIGTSLAGTVFLTYNGDMLDLTPLRSFPAVMLSTTAFFLVDTGGVATVIALCTGQRPPAVWKETFLWTSPGFFAGAGVSAVALIVLGSHVGTVLLFLAPVACLTYQSYAVYTARAAEKQKRIEEKQQHIDELQVSEAQLASALEREQRIASALQRSFLLTPPDGAFPHLTVETRYQAASDEALIGGDFYDSFALPDGKVALVIGDGSGKGLEAAARIAEVKYALRAYARESSSPGATLARLNDFVCDFQKCDGRPAGAFTALALAVVDTESGEVAISAAGTEPPLILRTGGEATIVVAGGMPLGVEAGEVYPDAVSRLAPGDLLLLVTDGITESRCRNHFLGYDQLVRTATEALSMGRAPDIAQGILDAAQRFAQGGLHDDACLLLAQWNPCAALCGAMEPSRARAA